MSGVLNRMVQRSRGQLPAIEPLVRAQQTAAAAMPLAVEERAAAASHGRNAGLAGGERASREESTGQMQNDARRNVARARDAVRKDSRQPEALEVARVKRALERDVTSAVKGADQDSWNKALPERDEDLRDVVQESEEPYESSIEMRAEKVPAKSEDATGGSIRPKAKLEQRAATRDISAVRNEADAAGSAMDAAEHTEIHITIGSVELRAPRVAPAPPKAPTFRPRVTLDEFLKRGTGSSGWGAKS